jgi:hypothetical protein
MARDILIRLNKLTASGKAPAEETVWFKPTVLRSDADGITVDDAFPVELVDGVGTANDVPTTDLNWAYRVQIGDNDRRGSWSWYVHVPEGDGPVNFEDLPRIDPKTMTPVNDPDPAWVAAVTAAVSDSVAEAVPTTMVAEASDETSEFRSVLNAATGQKIAADVPPLVAQSIASDSTVAQAAATAAATAMETAGDRVFYRLGGAANLTPDPTFTVKPDTSNLGKWWLQGVDAEWVQITDGPDGPANVIEVSGASFSWLWTRRGGWASAGLAGRKLTFDITLRRLPGTVANGRILITRYSPTGTNIFDQIVYADLEWTTRKVAFTIPANIRDDESLQIGFGVMGGSAGHVQYQKIRLYAPDEDLSTKVRAEVTDALVGVETDAWQPETAYQVGSTITTELGHRLRCETAHTSAVRFTDDLTKWRPLEAPPNEQTILGRARIGYGQSIGVGTKSVVAIRFDDWLHDLRDTILPMMFARALPSGLALISDLESQTWSAGVTPAQIKAWNEQGVEILSHGVNHLDPSPHDLMGTGGLYDQIVGSKKVIESWGLRCRGWAQPGAPTTIPGVSPYGDYNTWESLDMYTWWLVRNTYPVSESYVWGPTSRPIPHHLFHGADHRTISDGRSYTEIINTLNNMVDRGENIELMVHAGNLGKTGNMTVAEFEQVLDWIVERRDSGSVEVLTPSGLFFADRSTSRLNLLNNSSFENGTGWWQGFGGANTIEAGGYNGKKAARILGTTAVTQSVSGIVSRLWGGHTFMFTGYARAVSGAAQARVTLSNALTATASRDVGTDWVPVRYPFTLPPSAATLDVGLGQTGSGVEWSDIAIQPV